ncbi:uncharacterized protein EV420DRAFT_1490148 [Desarmillaria tabescens]|uniref:Uncharacterized protein n=1 Tax=Armillaria tabescens TaxID=1929756 RepID=A0AA39IXB5_ARMTA|nr:uncharacterized protein EV420DRAFT_1490148 [Desarmillaria tabescens]KAK0432202.1 hypothetical protein EV420DRAFT_1490148 [Desarmillaria tabescens]
MTGMSRELMQLQCPDREAVLMASDPASPEYQYNPEADAPSSEISPSDDEIEDPESSPSEVPPMESMEVDEESVEGHVSPRTIESASSFAETLIRGWKDLDSLMAGLSQPINHSGDEAPPPEANEGANNSDKIPSNPFDGSSSGIIDFRSLMNHLDGDMNGDWSENENSGTLPLAQAMTGSYVPTDQELLVLKGTTPYEMWTGLV